MKKYFLEPITGNLIVVDGNNGNTTILPELKNVRVFKADGQAYMTQGHEDNDLHSAPPPPGRDRVGARPGASKSGRKCSKCGEPGHQARHCEN